MTKKLKLKSILAVIFIMISATLIALSFILPNLSENQSDYMCSFGTSMMFVEILMLAKSRRIMKNPKLLKKAEINLSDERLITIRDKAITLTFRISVLAEALLSAVLAFAGNQFGQYLGLIVCAQLIVYLIASAIISKKI